MASTKVTLRTAFQDVFRFGDVEVTSKGTEFPTKAKADEAMDAARRSGVTLYVVEPEAATAEAKNEGAGS